MRLTIDRARQIALRPTMLYLLAGSVWILASDRILHALVQDTDKLSALQTYKGWFYVGSTGLVFFLVRLGLARRLQRAQEDLEQSQRIQALGRMAAGIAHDFRNILMVAGGNSEMARAALDAGHPARAAVEQAVQACDKGKQLANRLMAFAQGQASEPRPFTLGTLLTQARPMLQKLLPPATALEIEDKSAGALVLADPIAIEQALLNLAANAGQAFGAGDPAPRLSFRLAVHGGQLRLGVQDNGCGMPPEVQARIFEPFFTTKPAGEGVGLGLPTVFTTLQACGGKIRVQSQAGAGTTFILEFPIHRA